MKYFTLEDNETEEKKLQEVADMIKKGAVGIIPTDTVYPILCLLFSS